MYSTLADAIDRRALPLPVLSHIAQQAMAAMSDNSYDPGKLADLIHRDQTFAAHVVRIANSPMYRARVRIVSLRQAIAQLGIRTVSEMAFFIACRAATFEVGDLKAEVEGTFPHAFACAQHAKTIAEMCQLNGEELFLAGLLHDLGRPVLIQAAVSTHAKDAPDRPIDRLGLMRSVDSLHARASASLAESWRLPERIIVAIRDHHTPENAAHYERYVQVVALADVLAHATLESDYDLEPIRTHSSAARLGLSADKLETLLGNRDAIRELVDEMIS